MALYKPIYYKVLYFISVNEPPVIKEEKFNASSIALPQDIYSKASITKGLDETKVMPGIYAKGGFNFEYSKQDRLIHAIEVGAHLSGFPKKIPIMASSDNKSIFFALFVSYRFGFIIDPYRRESGSISDYLRRKGN
jgi:hypothetical protein